MVESGLEADCVTYKPRVYKIPMVRMFALAGGLTNLRMYRSKRRPRRNTELAVSNIYPLHLHGDNFFDLLDEWLDSELVLRSFPPRDETLIRHSMTQALNENPVFLPLAKDSRFQMMVNRLKASEEEK